MKLYMHPVSMTSRPVRLFIAESGIDVEEQVVDLMTGEHHQEPYASLNPNRMVPMLEDGDFRLTESSAILKYLADLTNSPTYPKDLKQRARVNEVMDWFNSNFYRDFGYGLGYPQVFPNHKRRSDEAQAATLEWAQERARGWLKILNDHIIGPERQYLCGSEITIADYLGVGLITLGEAFGCDFAKYPNVARWIANMKTLPHWEAVNEVFYGLVGAMKDKSFVTV
ncbi:MAG TPA: glutathione S-transferase family protein [Alphaproteobacteria bacterium]|nr:glutathione S-transferase family protein [Alphaproteobacteria bacterium]